MADNLDDELSDAARTEAPVMRSAPEATKAPDDITRRVVAYVLLGLIFMVVLIAFTDLFVINAQAIPRSGNEDAERLMKLMNVVFGPIITLFSSVVGFYFGARTAKEAKD